MNSVTLDVTNWPSASVAALMEYAHQLGVEAAGSVEDDESWRSAAYEGWTLKHVTLLREYLQERGDTARLECFDVAIRQGGWVSREQVYRISGYEPDRRLNGWTRPFDTAANLLEDGYDLPEDAPWPVWADYPEGSGFHQARGFYVHPGIVRLVREHEEARAGK